MNTSLYQIKINDIKGKDLDLIKFKGKKLMIVNVASECGLTKQYEQLEELNREFGEKLTVLGCPCNDFGGQEPGNEETIQEFCTLNFGVTFPLTQKLKIASDTHSLYQWLCKADMNGIGNFEVRWNFHKFLIEPDGSMYKSISSLTNPMDDEILNWVNL